MKRIIFKSIHLVFTFVFLFTVIFEQQSLSSVLNSPPATAINGTSPAFESVLLRGLQLDAVDPLNFNFILDLGDSQLSLRGSDNDRGNLSERQDRHASFAMTNQEALKLIKYFLSALTIPETDLWVNLSPYEPDRITSKSLKQIQMGEELLAQDYLLKKLTASLMHPDGETGRKFWDRIYSRIYSDKVIRGKSDRDRANITSITDHSSTMEKLPELFNKIWITPAKQEVYAEGNTVIVTEAKLKVMTESDYVAEMKSQDLSFPRRRESTGHNDRYDQNMDPRLHGDDNNQQPATDNSAKEIMKNILLPVIEHEVNHGESFAPLRQIHHSMILAKWYKENLKQSLLGQGFVDQGKIDGLSFPRRRESMGHNNVRYDQNMDPRLHGDDNSRQTINQIYQAYLDLFKTGVTDVIREEYDSVKQKLVTRKYFTGGFATDDAELSYGKNGRRALAKVDQAPLAQMKVPLKVVLEDHAMKGSSDQAMLFGAKKKNAQFIRPQMDFERMKIYFHKLKLKQKITTYHLELIEYYIDHELGDLDITYKYFLGGFSVLLTTQSSVEKKGKLFLAIENWFLHWEKQVAGQKFLWDYIHRFNKGSIYDIEKMKQIIKHMTFTDHYVLITLEGRRKIGEILRPEKLEVKNLTENKIQNLVQKFGVKATELDLLKNKLTDFEIKVLEEGGLYSPQDIQMRISPSRDGMNLSNFNRNYKNIIRRALKEDQYPKILNKIKSAQVKDLIQKTRIIGYQYNEPLLIFDFSERFERQITKSNLSIFDFLKLYIKYLKKSDNLNEISIKSIGFMMVAAGLLDQTLPNDLFARQSVLQKQNFLEGILSTLNGFLLNENDFEVVFRKIKFNQAFTATNRKKIFHQTGKTNQRLGLSKDKGKFLVMSFLKEIGFLTDSAQLNSSEVDSAAMASTFTRKDKGGLNEDAVVPGDFYKVKIDRTGYVTELHPWSEFEIILSRATKDSNLRRQVRNTVFEEINKWQKSSTIFSDLDLIIRKFKQVKKNKKKFKQLDIEVFKREKDFWENRKGQYLYRLNLFKKILEKKHNKLTDLQIIYLTFFDYQEDQIIPLRKYYSQSLLSFSADLESEIVENQIFSSKSNPISFSSFNDSNRTIDETIMEHRNPAQKAIERFGKDSVDSYIEAVKADKSSFHLFKQENDWVDPAAMAKNKVPPEFYQIQEDGGGNIIGVSNWRKFEMILSQIHIRGDRKIILTRNAVLNKINKSRFSFQNLDNFLGEALDNNEIAGLQSEKNKDSFYNEFLDKVEVWDRYIEKYLQRLNLFKNILERNLGRPLNEVEKIYLTFLDYRGDGVYKLGQYYPNSMPKIKNANGLLQSTVEFNILKGFGLELSDSQIVDIQWGVEIEDDLDNGFFDFFDQKYGKIASPQVDDESDIAEGQTIIEQYREEVQEFIDDAQLTLGDIALFVLYVRKAVKKMDSQGRFKYSEFEETLLNKFDNNEIKSIHDIEKYTNSFYNEDNVKGYRSTYQYAQNGFKEFKKRNSYKKRIVSNVYLGRLIQMTELLIYLSEGEIRKITLVDFLYEKKTVNNVILRNILSGKMEARLKAYFAISASILDGSMPVGFFQKKTKINEFIQGFVETMNNFNQDKKEYGEKNINDLMYLFVKEPKKIRFLVPFNNLDFKYMHHFRGSIFHKKMLKYNKFLDMTYGKGVALFASMVIELKLKPSDNAELNNVGGIDLSSDDAMFAEQGAGIDPDVWTNHLGIDPAMIQGVTIPVNFVITPLSSVYDLFDPEDANDPDKTLAKREVLLYNRQS